MTEKRFLLEDSDYDLKYEFRIADLSKVKKTKEDFWNDKEEEYNYRGNGGYLDYLYDNGAFLTQKEADELLNKLNEENQKLKQFKNKVFEFIDEEIKYKQGILELAEEKELEGSIAKASFELATLKIMRTKFKKIMDEG